VGSLRARRAWYPPSPSFFTRCGGAGAAAPLNPIPGTIIANRFQLVRELGRGTMGTVWLAQHLTLDVRCAVKFMSEEAAREPMYTARFALEARAIAQIQSPNIVRVLDYDLWNGVPFIAMERLVGEDLGARLHRVHKLDATGTRRIVAQVARGLSRAHAAGIVHRDLKPENIFLAREEDDEVAKLVDFGIAKFEGRAGRRTQVGEILGTPAYMSPEQTRCAQTIDARADLWSLGAIAFECLTGRLAFDGTSLGEIFARILAEPLPVPSQVAPELPHAFDAWFARAVCRDPEGRFADAREMSDALERALDDHPRRARLELVTARTLRPGPRRRRSGWPLALLGLAVGAVGVLALRPSLPPRLWPDLRSKWAPSAALPAPASTPPPLVVVVATPDLSSRRPPSAPESTPAQAPALASASAPESAPAQAPASAPALALASAPAPPSKPAAHHRAAPPRPVRAAAEAQRGGECSEGQRRCSGSVLQLCNAALDGWSDFIDCGENALCDATASGSGGCVPLPINPDPAAR
jgi:eukaryotic-like serine/threonine-protein kinase